MEQHLADTKLNDLPEDVLCRILSALSMLDAARASGTCSALLGAWRRYPHLIFDVDTLRLHRFYCLSQVNNNDEDIIHQNLKDAAASEFVRIVETIMMGHRRDTALESLTIEFAHLQELHAPCVDRWVRFALASTTTRRLKVDLLAPDDPWSFIRPESLWLDFPCSLLSAGAPAATALEHLYLRLGSVRLDSLSWPPVLTNLTTLVLNRVRITGEDLEGFISSCPRLQNLKLKYCDSLVQVKLPARLKQLRYFAVKRCWSVTTIDVSKSAVATLQLVITNRATSLLGEAAPAPKVTTASFHLFYRSGAGDPSFDATHLARLMPGLENLFLTFASPIKMQVGCGNKFYRLKRLELKMYYIVATNHGTSRRDELLFLHKFLEEAPVLEELSLHLMRLAAAFDASRIHPGGDGWFRKQPRRPHRSLRVAKVTGFDADLASLELVLYILENARSLERLSLDPAWTGHIARSDVEELSSSDPWFSSQIRLAREAIQRHIAPAVSPTSGVLLEIA